MVTSIRLIIKSDDPGGSFTSTALAPLPPLLQPSSDATTAHTTTITTYNPSLSGGGGPKGSRTNGDSKGTRVGGKKKGGSADGEYGEGSGGAKAGSSTGVGTKARGNGGRSRPQQTRSRHSHLITPSESVDTERELERTLRGMGLYASKTVGDGNCMFRALSDQLYGHDKAHVVLRQEICDYLQANPERYEGFVDTEKSFPEYVAIMRQNRTYGGHLELTAFARLKKRSIKVILPDYVYIVAGDDESPTPLHESSTSNIRPLDPRSPSQPSHTPLQDPTRPTSPKGKARVLPVDGTAERPKELPPGELVYLSYHIFEHYSSVRNVDGPHTGLAHVREKTRPMQLQTPPSSSSRAKPASHFQQRKEDLILSSIPPSCTPSLPRVTALLEQENGNWEKVVELLVEEDAVDVGLEHNGDGRGRASPSSAGEKTGFAGGNIESSGNRHLGPSRTIPPLGDDSGGESPDPLALAPFTAYRDLSNHLRERQSSPIAPSEDLETATSTSSDNPAILNLTERSSQNSNDSNPHTDGASSYTDSANASPAPESPIPRPGSRKRHHTSSSLGGSMLLANKRLNQSRESINGNAPLETSSVPAGSAVPGFAGHPRVARTVHSSLRGKEKREARKLRASLTRRQRIESEAWGSPAVDDAPDDGRRLTRGRMKSSTTQDDDVSANKIRELYI